MSFLEFDRGLSLPQYLIGMTLGLWSMVRRWLDSIIKLGKKVTKPHWCSLGREKKTEAQGGNWTWDHLSWPLPWNRQLLSSHSHIAQATQAKNSLDPARQLKAQPPNIYASQSKKNWDLSLSRDQPPNENRTVCLRALRLRARKQKLVLSVDFSGQKV